ncbi:MAG TPA: DoxX family protein [Gemmataceae bacterium]|nr:DoxX family protein [Gemmataceae bacterium]
MNGMTRFFLVLLRFAIGWHFLFEGLDKIQSVNLGVTETSRPWTSKAYLRESMGPLADYFHRQAGDTDEEALAILEVRPLSPGEDPAKVPVGQRISPILAQAWNEYFQRFADHYKLEGAQRRMAEGKLAQAKEQAVRWLLGEAGIREVEHTYGPSASVKIKESPAQRLQDYRQKVQELREIMDEKLPAFGRDVEKRHLTSLKADVNRMRSELLADLEKPMQETLQSVLTEEQKKMGPIPVAVASHWWEQGRLGWIDWITRYGLTAVGACLLLGLFTRSACLAGAAFLILFYLAMPALPWLPESPRAEGHYVFINKNIIEMLALLALATTRSGFWAGLDGIFYCLAPWHWGARRAPAPVSR